MSQALDSVDIYDRMILRYLLLKGTPATLHEISRQLKLSWNTVKTHIRKLEGLGLVIPQQGKRVTYWTVNQNKT